ncbi:MAG: hypothetical protein AVDCRST_MAG77-2902 [uncultured Chloroflexi bacterium]|uniref:DUF790 family protein n=1 Tax=uncultured Chloroflexota bacterium TaxID=166587 RepID=A0A6J4J1U1_9CHLR|nr:MAG: hypothetical protein AVDCRST_MAG77-2902 [uncultured Chloroflexota bacterium]
MPFSLPDLKRTYGRSGVRGGATDVRPYLLVGTELEAQRRTLEATIEWFQERVGVERRNAPVEELAVLVGDYRLARCLASCLQVTFAFRPPSLESAAVAAAGDPSAGRRLWLALQERGISEASGLRLHVFGQANRGAGYVAPATRELFLDAVGDELGCDGAVLDRLLWCDAEEHERLTVVGQTGVPAPEALASHYNRRALETLLCRCVSADLLLPNPDGTAIRRLYLAVKRSYLLCELSLAEPDVGPSGGVWAHLFGPLEMFGPRTRHGDRFARAVLELLRAFPDLSGEARVLINEREYTLRLPPGIAEAVRHQAPLQDADVEEGDGAEEEPEAVAVVRRPDEGVRFDSNVERRLYETLRGMERRGDTRGWTVEREPEPLVHGGVVMVPDFVLSRGAGGGAGSVRREASGSAQAGHVEGSGSTRVPLSLPKGSPRTASSRGAEAPAKRVFVEVIGFWTPQYRERKKAKLLALDGQADLVLVVDEELASDFRSLPFPVLGYKRRPSAVDLVTLLDRTYGAAARPESAGERVRAWLDDSEVAKQLGDVFARLLPNGDVVALDVVREAVRRSGVKDAEQAADHLEALLPPLGFEVVWESIFEATVRRK